MQAVEFTPSQLAGVVAQDALRRIESLAFLSKAAAGLTPRRRQDVQQAIEQARIALMCGDARKLESTMAGLDLLSLELCDE